MDHMDRSGIEPEASTVVVGQPFADCPIAKVAIFPLFSYFSRFTSLFIGSPNSKSEA
jgi:hypothetical protein